MASESEGVAKATPHDELCDKALELYEKMVTAALGPQDLSNAIIPKAIEFYKKYYVRRGERKIIYTPGKLEEALKEGWVFDPWLNPRGRPIPTGGPTTIGGSTAEADGAYWILVKGTPEQVKWLDPFVDLPEEEIDEVEAVRPEPYGIRTEFISYDSNGKPSREPEDGYVVMHKDHIFAKGTVYTLQPGAQELTPWTVAKDLAKLANIGVDEAHDALIGILKKK